MPVTALGSHLTEAHENPQALIQFHGALRSQVLNSPALFGLLLPVLGDNCLLKEFVSQIPPLS